MAEISIWDELTKLTPRKRVYFMWKNGLDTTETEYSKMTKEEMIASASRQRYVEIQNKNDYWFKLMERWESSAEYKRLLFLLQEDKFATDILNVYAKVKELADTGDSQAIKNMLLLQKEIKSYRKSIDNFQKLEEKTDIDDGLVI